MRLRSGEVRSFCVLDDLPSLLWAANQGAIELHPLLLRRERPDETTTVVFDLDPTEPAGLVECCEVALLLRGALEGRGLTSFVKTSGAAGLHLFVPLGPGHGFGASKVFARSLAGALAAKRPGLVADKQRRSERVGQVLVDWLQNDPMRSTVAPYSLRATQIPSVSTPVAWEEVERALRLEQPDSLVFGPADVLERVARAGDLWAGAVEVSQTMPR
jgi:bifunctional non-homologous end joining protein LigD